MIFTLSLYASLAIFLVGSLVRIAYWFRVRIGPESEDQTIGARLGSACRGFVSMLFSRRIFSFLKVFLLDVLLQVRILRKDFLRWVMHILIFYGFVLLLLMHALEQQVTEVLFPDYTSTLNPYLFLRNLFGAMVMAGLLLAVFRRARLKGKGVLTNRADRFLLLALATVMITGFLLEGSKILSAPIFHEMVDEYAPMAEPEEIQQLQVYWAKDFGVVFPHLSPAAGKDPALAQEGRLVHEDACIDCHAHPTAAFVSYPLAKLLSPAGGTLNRFRIDRWFLTLHYLVCFIGLACLPISKLFHVISSPASLLANLAPDPSRSTEANRASKRALALDACTHCGACSEHCSVHPVFRQLLNPNILPSEKLISTQTMARGEKPGRRFLQELSEGSFLCTSCYRCTEVCPVAINLQDLWIVGREDLIRQGFPEPHIWVREASTATWMTRLKKPQDKAFSKGRFIRSHLNLSDRSETFYACVQCQTCTNVCPVVACAEDPVEDLEVTPQQVMNLLRLGLKDVTLGSRMVWDCTTCYMCQEHCPEGIPVADILYELRNLAYDRFQEIRAGESEEGSGAHAKQQTDPEESLS